MLCLSVTLYLCSDKEKRRLFNMAEEIIYSLSSDDYLAKTGTNGLFILQHCIESILYQNEIDSPLFIQIIIISSKPCYNTTTLKK
jgi:hypothetical protein